MNKLTLLIIAFISCNSAEEHNIRSASKKEMSDTCYADIDYYNIRGVNQLNEKSYPFITIQDSISKRIISFHTSKDHFFSKEFLRKDSFWVSYFDYEADTSHIYSYELVLKDSVLIFNYADTASYLLEDISCISGNAVTIFFLSRGKRIKPTIENFSKVTESFESKHIEEFVLKDSILQKGGRKVDRDGRVVFENTECFLKNERSIFWWIYFGHTQQAIDCREYVSKQSSR